MSLRVVRILALLAAVVMGSHTASAGLVCGPTADMVAHLSDKWQESGAFEGLVNEKARMVLFVNAESRTWTIIVVQSNGTSCVLLSGTEGDVVPLTQQPGHPT